MGAAAAHGQPRHVHREPRQRVPLARPAGGSARRRDLSGLRGRRNPLRRRRRGARRGDRRHGRREGRLAQERIPARHGAPREVHAVRRRLPRLAVAGADAAVQPARRRRSAEVRHRHQGAVAGRAGASTRRDSCCTARAGRSTRRPAAARSSTTSATASSSVGFVVHLNYENPHLSPYDEFQRFKTHPGDSRHVRRRQAPRATARARSTRAACSRCRSSRFPAAR